MIPSALKKRKALALRESNLNGKKKTSSEKKTSGKKKPSRKTKPAPKPSTGPRSISNIVEDVFTKASDSFVEKQRRGSTVPNTDVENEIMRHYRPNRKTSDDLDGDEVSIEDQPVDEAEAPGKREHSSPGPLVKAVNAKVRGQTFLKKSSSGGKGKVSTKSGTKAASTKPKLVRFGHIVFVPVSPEANGYGVPTLCLPNSIHLGVLRRAGLVLDPAERESDLAVPFAATQSEISDFLKPRFPLPFEHLADDNEWCLLTIANKKLADFGSQEPKGADFGTVVGGQKGTAIIDKVIYLAPYESFPKKVVKKLGLEAVVEYLQGEIPTRRSKRRLSSPAGDSDSGSDSDSDSDSDMDEEGRGTKGDKDDDGEGGDDDDSEGSEDGDAQGGEDSDGSASIRPPKKRRRVSPDANNGRAFDNLFDSDIEALDGDPFVAVSTPGPSRHTFKGKENRAIELLSSSPSIDQDNPWYNAASYQPKMPFLNM